MSGESKPAIKGSSANGVRVCCNLSSQTYKKQTAHCGRASGVCIIVVIIVVVFEVVGVVVVVVFANVFAVVVAVAV